MIRFYQGSGSSEISLLDRALDDEQWTRLKVAAIRLLKARDHTMVAEMLEKIPFEILNGTNYFKDEFAVLHAKVPLERYVVLSETVERRDIRAASTQLATTITEIGPYVRFITVGLETEQGLEPVQTPTLLISSASVERALQDAMNLLQTSGAGSAVDRVHTALHAYIRAACERAGLEVIPDESITSLFKKLRKNHPAFTISKPGNEDVLRIGNALATIVDALNPIRNRASGAHPNAVVLAEAEAMLVINTVRTLLHYLDSKLA